MRCANCGFDLPDSATTCEFCQYVVGGPLAQAVAEPAAGSPLPAPDPSEPQLPVPAVEPGLPVPGEAELPPSAEQPPPSSWADPLASPPPLPGRATTPLPGGVQFEVPETARHPAGAGGGLLGSPWTLLALSAGVGWYLFKGAGQDDIRSLVSGRAAPTETEEEAPSLQPAPAEDRPEPPAATAAPVFAPAAPSPPASAPPARTLESWVFEGTVYDMLTLKPVFGADITFLGGSNGEDLHVESDEGGRYRLQIPALSNDAYKILVDHPDYLEDYFDEISPPYRSVDARTRRQLRGAKPLHRPWTGESGKPARRDIVLFPASPDAQDRGRKSKPAHPEKAPANPAVSDESELE